MNYSNLKTKLTVCPNIAKLDYVTNDQLNTTLDSYVKEAPVDGKTYGRVDAEWKAVKSNMIFVYSGFSNCLVIDDSGMEGSLTSYDALQLDELSLECLDIEAKEYLFHKESRSNSECAWFCTSVPVTSIVMADFNLPIPYEKVQVVRHDVNGEDVKFFCYRTDKLIADDWKFKIKF